jgi:hypothetical protein
MSDASVKTSAEKLEGLELPRESLSDMFDVPNSYAEEDWHSWWIASLPLASIGR